MSGKYYYLVASLPHLRLDGESPISGDRFLSECEKWLSEHDMETLRAASIRSAEKAHGDVDLLARWEDFEGTFRKNLAAARAYRKKGEEGKVSEEIRTITAQENPLAMERSIEKRRWDFLDGIAQGYFFDLNRLIVYYLQLQLLERLATFNKDKGESQFHELCEVDYEKTIG
jgi:hypothetical protein